MTLATTTVIYNKLSYFFIAIALFFRMKLKPNSVNYIKISHMLNKLIFKNKKKNSYEIFIKLLNLPNNTENNFKVKKYRKKYEKI